MLTHWTVYTRPGCSLCETLMADLAALLGEAAAARVQVVDITGDTELERRYSSKVPVLTADHDFVCAYYLDRDRVAAYL